MHVVWRHTPYSTDDTLLSWITCVTVGLMALAPAPSSTRQSAGLRSQAAAAAATASGIVAVQSSTCECRRGCTHGSLEKAACGRPAAGQQLLSPPPCSLLSSAALQIQVVSGFDTPLCVGTAAMLRRKSGISVYFVTLSVAEQALNTPCGIQHPMTTKCLSRSSPGAASLCCHF